MCSLIWRMNVSRKLRHASKSLEELENFLDSNVEHSEVPEIDISETKKAYCPIIARNCVVVDCGRCEVLKEEFPERMWLCSDCIRLDGIKLVPFWHDGNCDCCGEYSIVLCMATLPPDDQD